MTKPKKKKQNNFVFAINQTRQPNKLLLLCKKALLLSMQELHISNHEVSVVFVTNTTIQKLNRRYRNKNYATDVLSFTNLDSSHSKRPHLGDIVISISIARQNAKEDKKTLDEELILLSTHGLLHLLGYDHEKPKDAKKMFSIQNRLVQRAVLCLIKSI